MIVKHVLAQTNKERRRSGLGNFLCGTRIAYVLLGNVPIMALINTSTNYATRPHQTIDILGWAFFKGVICPHTISLSTPS
jgi:hypothetical protein